MKKTWISYEQHWVLSILGEVLNAATLGHVLMVRSHVKATNPSKDSVLYRIDPLKEVQWEVAQE